jgi:UDP-glucose 4-epimerase
MNVLVTGGLRFYWLKVVLQLLKRNISVIVADLDIKKNKEN